MLADVSASPSQPAVDEREGFRRIISVATLVLVGAIAIMSTIELFAPARTPSAEAAPAAQPDEASVAMSQSLDATRDSLARVEQQLEALASANAEPLIVAPPAQAPAMSREAYAALTRSIHTTGESIARVEQKLDALVLASAQPVTEGPLLLTPARDEASLPRPCVRTYRGAGRRPCDR
jgi:hypothetical protein